MTILGNGNVGIGTTSPSNTLHVQGSLCVKSAAGNCAGSTAGTIYATTTTVSAADYAEYFMAEESMNKGDIVGLSASSGLVRSYRPGDKLLGVVSTNPGVIGNTDIQYQKSVLVALMGQVDFNRKTTKIESNTVSTVDGKVIGHLLYNGLVYLNISSTSESKADKSDVESLRNENALYRQENISLKIRLDSQEKELIAIKRKLGLEL